MKELITYYLVDGSVCRTIRVVNSDIGSVEFQRWQGGRWCDYSRLQEKLTTGRSETLAPAKARAMMEKTAKRCPGCQSTETIPVSYGLPTVEMARAEERGDLIFGGRYFDSDSPMWHCKSCGYDWGQCCQIEIE